MWKRHARKILWIYIDEIDFMNEYCFEVIASVAIERAEIGITVSSTPLGKRSHFYRMCTDKSMGYSEHYHPSTHNPSWGAQMEAELKAQLSSEGYVHEVLAEFGTQQAGVFDKDKLDLALSHENYTYEPLTYTQQIGLEREGGTYPIVEQYSRDNPYTTSPFITIGVDWD